MKVEAITVDKGFLIPFNEKLKKIKQQKTQLLTKDYIIDETVTRLRYDLGYSISNKK